MRWLLTFIGFNAVLLTVVLLTLWASGSLAGMGLSAHGWIAMALGIAFTSGLGVALMALVFHSARRDYDDAAHRAGRHER